MWRWGRKPADMLKSSLCMSVLGLNHKVQSFIHRALHFCQEIKHFENQIFNSLLCQVSFCSTDEEILVSLLSKFAQAPSSTVGPYSNFLCLDPRPTTNVGDYLQRFRNLSFIFQQKITIFNTQWKCKCTSITEYTPRKISELHQRILCFLSS